MTYETANPEIDRVTLVPAMAREGKTYAQIGEVLGVRRQRVKQILDRMRRDDPTIPLPRGVRQADSAFRRAARTAKPRPRHADLPGATPEQYTLLRAKLHQKAATAKRLGIPFSLTIAALWPIPTVCPVLGIPISLTECGHRDNYVSFDRFDPSKGYTPENTLIMSYRANRIKNDATPAELRKIADFFTKHQLQSIFT